MFMASMSFGLGEDIEALREATQRWAQDRLAPMAAEIDRSNEFPAELWKETVSYTHLTLPTIA